LPFAAASSSTVAGTSPSALASVPSTTALTAVVVHVAGAVLHAGVYTFSAGSRVVDAVQRAGGLAADADPDAVNLAALLVDGQRVYVPRIGEPAPPLVDGGGPTTVAGPIDLNRATADELDALPGVGPATAAAIVAYREQHGPFGTVDDLADVRGIGPAKVEALRGLVTV
jgi:competence protein ComEA